MGDVITRFKLETTQYDSKLRNATDRLKDLIKNVQVAGGSLSDLTKEDKELAKSFGSLDLGAKNAKDAVKELTSSFNTLARQYNAMTKEMRESDVGRDIAGQMNVLRDRIKQAKTELYDYTESVDDSGVATAAFSGVLQELGAKLGINTKLLSSLTTGTLATTAAVTAGVTAVVAATKAWADYNDEMNRQSTATTVVTGLKGTDAEELTIGVRALSRTYDVDFRQSIEAANTLIQQFGVSGEEALSLLQDGMRGMLAGDGAKLLNMIQQYAPSFRDAGISASQLVAIIQNSEGGIFTDQNMSAISMGIRNIRLMTESTSKALAQLGIDGEEMTKKLDDGSMTIFEAMQQVSTAIENAGSSSQAVGQVMQTVFGRQGYTAGTNLGKAIAQLNTDLEQTKLQTGELGDSFVKLNEANLRLERTMKEIFGMNGWSDMSNTIKTEFADALSDALDYVIEVRDALNDIGTSDSFATLADAAARFVPALYPVLKGLETVTGLLEKAKSAWNDLIGNTQPGGGTFSGIGQGITKSISGLNVPRNVLPEVVVTPNDGKKPPKSPTGGGGKSGQEWAPVAMGNFEGLNFGRSLSDVQKELQRAQTAYNEAGDAAGRAMAKAMIDELKREKETIMAEGDVKKGGLADAYNYDFNKEKKSIGEVPTETQDTYSWEEMKNTYARVVEELSQVSGGLQQMGVELPDGVNDALKGMQGLISVINGVESIITLFNSSTAAAQIAATTANTIAIGVLSGAVVANTTAMSVNTATNLVPFFAKGGIVPKAATGMVIPGNDFADRTPVLASAGELILNKSSQANLASLLQAVDRGEGGGDSRKSFVKGEDIFLGVNNYLRRSGRGELVTSR